MEKNKKKVKFKNLTDENKDYIALTYYDEELNHKEKIEILTNKFGVTGRTIRKWWLNLDLSKPTSKLPRQLIEARDRNVDIDTKIMLVTSAQNETPISRKQLASMTKYREFLTKKMGKKTQIAVIPIRYRKT